MYITLTNPKNGVETQDWVEPGTGIVFVCDGFCGGSTGLTLAQWLERGFTQRPTLLAPDSLKAGDSSLPDVVKSASNLPA